MKPGTPRQSGCVDVHEDAVDAGATPAPATTFDLMAVVMDDMQRALDMAFDDDCMERWQRVTGCHPDQIARRAQRARRRVRMARKRRRGW